MVLQIHTWTRKKGDAKLDGSWDAIKQPLKSLNTTHWRVLVYTSYHCPCEFYSFTILWVALQWGLLSSADLLSRFHCNVAGIIERHHGGGEDDKLVVFVCLLIVQWFLCGYMWIKLDDKLHIFLAMRYVKSVLKWIKHNWSSKMQVFFGDICELFGGFKWCLKKSSLQC